MNVDKKENLEKVILNDIREIEKLNNYKRNDLINCLHYLTKFEMDNSLKRHIELLNYFLQENEDVEGFGKFISNYNLKTHLKDIKKYIFNAGKLETINNFNELDYSIREFLEKIIVRNNNGFAANGITSEEYYTLEKISDYLFHFDDEDTKILSGIMKKIIQKYKI